MKKPFKQEEKRGSALLIVLGLLGFLMISAVAFSITMRTEYKAAAAYRQSVIARDLIATAFAEAQYAVELSMEASAKELAEMPRDEKRRREYLCPFKSANEDKYGRIIASSNNANWNNIENNNDIAYLLDERAMRHVSPYVAFDTFNILELGGGGSSLEVLQSKNENVYTINDYARWRPIIAQRSLVDVSDTVDNNRVENVSEVIIGRMAWAVINLSDSLDINGIGSAQPIRGLGLTGSEFAYTSGNVGDDALFKADADFANCPVFCTNADLSQYTALSSDSSSIFIANGETRPIYSWIFAADDEGYDHLFDADAKSIFSPFSVYSFWPDLTRGQKFSSNMTETTYPVNVLTEASVNDGSAENYLDEELFNNLGASAQAKSIRDNFVRLLGDYLDKNQIPTFDTNEDDYRNHSFPCAENVPMVNEVGYDVSKNITKENFNETIDSIVKAIEDLPTMPGNTTNDEWNSLKTLADAGVDNELKVTLKKDSLGLDVALGAYYPTTDADNTDTYNLYSKGFVAVSSRVYLNNAQNESILPEDKAIVAKSLSDGSAVSITGGSDVFTKGSYETLTSKDDVEILLNTGDIPVRIPETVDPTATDQNITIRCLVDFFFRAEIEGGDGLVDRVPVSDGLNLKNPSIDDEAKIEEELKKAYANGRNDINTMGILDGQFFRVTKAIEITFSIRWIEEGAGQNAKYVCRVFGADGKGSPEVRIVDNLNFGNDTFAIADNLQASPISISPNQGVWSTIDPRYNWISPMFGTADNAEEYIGGNLSILRNFSSPHWLFVPNMNDLSATGTTPSNIQIAYEETHLDIVPFSWGLKVEDIRYNTNDTGTMLMPSEIAFLPVPKASNQWYSETRRVDYLEHSIATYHATVGEESFFRTIPIVDLGDNVITGNEQSTYNRLVNTFTGFKGIPEEHRSIMSVYAGQDNYVLGQRLRRLALKGIPASIKDAIAVTKTRLTEAADAGRATDSLVQDINTLLGETATGAAPTKACEKYNTFINDYLFPIPDDSNEKIDWAIGGSLSADGSVDALRAPRPQNALDPLGIFGGDVTGIESSTNVDDSYFADIIKLYNEQAQTPDGTTNDNCKLGQNDITNLVAFSRECFGDRQQLFLYIMRVDTTAAASGNRLHEATPTSTTRAVALVWRDAYGEIPSRVIYFTLL